MSRNTKLLCSFLTDFQSTFSQIISRSGSERKTSLIINLDPYSYTELVIICLSLKALLRKSLTRKLLGMGRRAFNLLGRQELHLAPLWVQMGACATSMPPFSVSKKGKSFLICKLRANGLAIPTISRPGTSVPKYF